MKAKTKSVLIANIRDLPNQIMRFYKAGRMEEAARCERILNESRQELNRRGG